MVGKFMAFDKYMNLVLGDCEEFRKLKGKKGGGGGGRKDKDGGGGRELQEAKRSLGLVLLRGETVVSLSVAGLPPVDPATMQAGRTALPGPGIGRAAGRGLGPAHVQQPPLGGGMHPPGGGAIPIPMGGGRGFSVPPPFMMGTAGGASPMPPIPLPGQLQGQLPPGVQLPPHLRMPPPSS